MPVIRQVTLIGHDYWCDPKGQIFYGHSYDEPLNVIRGRALVAGADARSFEVLNHIWARDARRIYMRSRSIRAHRDSFEVLNAIYARDRDSIYYLSGRAKEIDRDSFEILDTGEQPNGPHERVDPISGAKTRVDFYGFARDKTHVYYHEMLCGKPRIIRYADRETFEVVGEDFSRDKDAVFLRETRVKAADRATFKPLGGGFFRDRRHVFYDTRIIREADLESFVVVDPDNFYARDKNYLYSHDRILRPVEFLKPRSRDDERIEKDEF